jgi:VWFA-related protein
VREADVTETLRRLLLSRTAVIGSLLALAVGVDLQSQPRDQESAPSDERFRFRTGVELISVSATVTDANGRFVPSLSREDFRLYEDSQSQEITHFSSERVPVSLGIAIDTSGSMAGDKWDSAVTALERLLDMLRPGDEVFLYRFSSDPELVHDWTDDSRRIRRVLGRIEPDGGTALHDGVAQAVRRAQNGRHRKKTVLVISDGHDNSSDLSLAALRQLIRETEVMVYSIALAGPPRMPGNTPEWFPPRTPFPIPFPMPGRRRPPRWQQVQWPPQGFPAGSRRASTDSVNVAVLRDITDDTGGRTEVVRSARDLKPATAGIADELSQQYYLGYPGTGKKDGQWHSIRVETRDTRLRVRARRGYTATR